MLTENIIELANSLVEKDEALANKNDKELIKVNRELEQVNSDIGIVENAIKSKELLDNSLKEYEVKMPLEEAINKEFKNARKELSKKDEFVQELSRVESEIEKYEDINNINALINSLSDDRENNSLRLNKALAEKEETAGDLSELRSELDGLKNVGVSIEELKNKLEKLDERIKELDELNEENNKYINGKRELEALTAQYIEDNDRFKRLRDVYEEMEQAFRDGQAGILASTLTEGEKCPVCGSVTHPDKAKLTDEIPSEAELNQAKVEASHARDKVNEASSEIKSKRTFLEVIKKQLNKKAAVLLSDSYKDDSESDERLDVVLDESVVKSRKFEITTLRDELDAKLKNEREREKRKTEIEDKLISEYEDELKSIDEKIALLKIKIAEIDTSIDGHKVKGAKIKESLLFSDMSEALKRKDELTCTIDSIQSAYDNKEKEWNKIHDEVTGLKSTIESLKKSLKDIDTKDVSKMRERKAILDESRNELIRKIQEERTRIKINKNVLENIKDTADSLKETEKKLSLITALSKTANGDLSGKEKIKLETYIQTTYFDRIIRRANLRFMEMSSGQYELLRQRTASDIRGQSGLELVVIDHYNGTNRSVRTLSGGESFMASLSLALGLSEEVQSSAGGVSVDTLFVDEGFGTLDSDSLDLAYKALTNVSEGNRLVGIISHVAELRNKIDNQIIVKKEKSGGSVAAVRV